MSLQKEMEAARRRVLLRSTLADVPGATKVFPEVDPSTQVGVVYALLRGRMKPAEEALFRAYLGDSKQTPVSRGESEGQVSFEFSDAGKFTVISSDGRRSDTFSPKEAAVLNLLIKARGATIPIHAEAESGNSGYAAARATFRRLRAKLERYPGLIYKQQMEYGIDVAHYAGGKAALDALADRLT